jgi:hypothetical protein
MTTEFKKQQAKTKTILKPRTNNKGPQNTRTNYKGQTQDQRAQPRTKETEQVQSTQPKNS